MKLRARHVRYTWDALNGLLWAAVIVAVASCATEPYWTKTHEPVPVKAVITVDAPCGQRDWNGCSSRLTGLIMLKRGLSTAERLCAEGHELKHMAGYSHHDRITFVADCGDGTRM